MRTETELRKKLAEAGAVITARNVKSDCKRYWERFAIKLSGVLGPPMQTEQEVCARLDEHIKRMERPFLKSSRVMFWSSEAAYLQWILQPPEPVVDEAVLARAQAKADATGKPVSVWADTEGTHTATKRPGRKCKMLVPEERPPKPERRSYVHVPKGVEGYTRKKDPRTYAERVERAARRARALEKESKPHATCDDRMG